MCWKETITNGIGRYTGVSNDCAYRRITFQFTSPRQFIPYRRAKTKSACRRRNEPGSFYISELRLSDTTCKETLNIDLVRRGFIEVKELSVDVYDSMFRASTTILTKCLMCAVRRPLISYSRRSWTFGTADMTFRDQGEDRFLDVSEHEIDQN